MQTLQEFIVYTKGWEYLIAIGFVLAFMVFWQIVARTGQHR
ncbi:MAG: sulfate respiration complex protein HmcD [Chloroflexota bacterium]